MRGRILGGLALVVVGGVIIYFHNQIYKLFGDIERAERNVGDSRILYVLLGVFIIVVGVFVMFSGGGSADVDSLSLGAS